MIMQMSSRKPCEEIEKRLLNIRFIHNISLSVIYVFFPVTIKSTFSRNKAPCPFYFQNLLFLSSIKCSRCHLGDLHKFCNKKKLHLLQLP